jgi:Homing endonuclease associated repeat
VAARLFGSWKVALEAAGFAAKPAAFTEEDVIAALIADAQRLGRAPYLREWHHRPHHLPGVGAVIGHFGSWTDGLRAAGLRSPQEKDRWTEAATLRAARKDAARHGRPPRAHEWPRSTASHPSAAIAGRLFGSWNKMLSAGGLATLKRGEPTAEQLTRRGAQMTKALKGAQAELGVGLARPAYQTLARDRGWPSASAISHHFGSWPKACEAAGVARHHWADITDDALLELLRDHAAEIGRLPRKSEWARSTGKRPSSAVIVHRLGSWTAALQAAGLGPPRFTQHAGRSPERLGGRRRAE